MFINHTKEGFVPERYIDSDLQNIIKREVDGDLYMVPDPTLKDSQPYKLYENRTDIDISAAKHNTELCKDTEQYHACAIQSYKTPKLDLRYITLPPKTLDTSSIYNHLSICPQTYASNIQILRQKQSLGQYSGYTDNGYIDRTRYVVPDKPLPVNPDFFMKGGGTYA
jgi:hypothetical protein